MMSLDRNSDGFLEPGELPGSLNALLKTHDRNSDGKLDAAELASVERKARDARDERPQESSPRGGRRKRGGAGRQAGGAAASPINVDQILRFALTFDADMDGGLNAQELKRYAQALAARRAQGRGPMTSQVPEEGEASAAATGKGTAKGLGDPAEDDEADPFGSKPPGK